MIRFVLPAWRSELPAPPDVSRILVIRQHNQLGDMLCAVPLLRALRSKYSSARIALMASAVNFDVMGENRYVDSLMLFDKDSGITSLLTFLRTLRKEQYDIVLVPMTVSMSFTSCLLAFLSGGKIRIGAEEIDGRKNTAAAFLNVRLKLDWREEPQRHQTLRNLDTAQVLALPQSGLNSEIFLTKEENDSAGAFLEGDLKERDFFLAFHPGAGKVPNRWPARRFAVVANELAARFNARILVTSGPMDDEPVAAMLSDLHDPPVLVKGHPIRKVAAILSHMKIVISNDTGIMHVASAVNVPVLSLFGPTDPLQWAPIGTKHRFLHFGDDIELITVADVLKNADEMLQS